MRKRQPSKLLTLNEIHQGHLLEMPDKKYFMIGKEAIPKVQVYGCVIEKRDISPPDKRRFITIQIDDGTDTIGLTVWSYPKNEYGDPITMLEDVEVGDIVDVIGRVRDFNDEFFINPQAVTKKTDGVIWEIYRRTQILKQKMEHSSLQSEEILDFSKSTHEHKSGSVD